MLSLKVVGLFFVSAILALSAYAVADSQPAPGLVEVLQGLREVNTSFIVAWSAAARAPSNPADKVSALKVEILRLDPQDREALLFWLRSHGRDALHQRGITDAQIGPPLFPIDYDIAWTTVPAGFVNPTPLPTATPPPTPTPTSQSQEQDAFAHGLLAAISVLTMPTMQIPAPVASAFESGNSIWTAITSGARAPPNVVNAYGDILGLTNMLGTAAVAAGALASASAAGALASAPAPVATPQEASPVDERWILLDFGRERDQPENGDIVVNRGVAGIRNNAEAAACIAFANRTSRAVREVDFDLTFLDANNFALQTMPLRRTGNFEPGAEIPAPRDIDPAKVGSEDANCVTTGGAAADAAPNPALARTVALTYAVRRILYDDGTVWQRPGTNRWPAVKP